MTDLSEVRDRVDVAQRLQEMYSLPDDVAVEIMAAAPYARFTCTVLDVTFTRLLDDVSRRQPGTFTAESVEALGTLVGLVLKDAEERGLGADSLNRVFRLMGHSDPGFPEELNYNRALPAMRLLLPRLIEMRLQGTSHSGSGIISVPV